MPEYSSTQPIPESGAEIDGSGTSSHINIVALLGNEISAIRYAQSTFVITTGQPYEKEMPIVCYFDSVLNNIRRWNIQSYCGRKKSRPPASSFIDNSGGAQHLFGIGAIRDSQPEELNFTFGVDVDLLIDNKTATIRLYFGQGSPLPGLNNWWIGSKIIEPPGKFNYYTLTVTIDGTSHLFNVLAIGGVQFQLSRQT